MKRNLRLVYATLAISAAALMALTGCRAGVPVEVTLGRLLETPERFDGRLVVVEGYYFAGFETLVIAERLEPSGYAAGHLVHAGGDIWVEGGLGFEIHNRLYRQDMMGPEERYGRVRVNGIFEYRGQYGHLGSFDRQIIPRSAEILPWTPPPL